MTHQKHVRRISFYYLKFGLQAYRRVSEIRKTKLQNFQIQSTSEIRTRSDFGQTIMVWLSNRSDFGHKICPIWDKKLDHFIYKNIFMTPFRTKTV